MTKKLLAIAVAAGLAVPAAAMADATIYGKFHMSIDSYDADATSGTAVASNSSRIGFKGSEDLGGGLSVIWQSESTLNIDDGSGSLSGRNSFLGLKGGWGTFLVGKHDSPVKTIGRKVDLFGDQVGDSRSIIRGSYAGGDLDPRYSNVIMYATPKMGAFGGAIQYVPDENEEDATDTTSLSIAGWFDQGPLYIGLGYQSDEADDGTPTNDTETVTRLVAAYKMDAFKVTALYQTATALGNVEDNDGDMYGIGGAFSMGGGNTIKAQYYTLSADPDDSDSSVYAIGFDHKFSKQTTGYVAYAGSDNDDNIAVTPWGGTGHDNLGSGTGGESATVFSVGLVHKF